MTLLLKLCIPVLLLFFCSSAQCYSDETADPNKSNLENMILIPGGTFEMGIDEDDIDSLVIMGHSVPKMEMNARWWYADEVPKHTVVVDSFYLDLYEVTNRQFSRFVKSTGYHPQGDWWKYDKPERKDHPVVNVTWFDAGAYAKWAGKRLPTEEEWEYAAKGGMDVKWFPWGNEPDDGTRANYDHSGESFFEGVWKLLGFGRINTKPVGCYEPNGFGLYDMCGNVQEWIDGSHKPYPCAPVDAVFDNGQIKRGGGWESCNPVYVRLNNRHASDPKHYSWASGFRCAYSLIED